MEIWMVVVAVVIAIAIVCLPKLIKNWYKNLPHLKKMRECVDQIQNFQEKYPNISDYEKAIILELQKQQADIDIIKNLLGSAYNKTLTQAYRSHENPMRFTDRWLYSSIAPKRWDYIDGILHYYVYIVQILLDKECRPTSLIMGIGGKQIFIECIETAYAKEIDPDILIKENFLSLKH